jgi:hypothetical protein
MRSLVIPIFLLAGCAAPEPTRNPEADIAKLTTGMVAGETRSCVSTTGATSSLTVVNTRTLSYSDGGKLWINRLPGECRGLNRMSALVVEAHGSEYCRGDRFRSRDYGSTILGPYCALGDFTMYRKP